MARHELDALLALSRVRESPPQVEIEMGPWLRELAEPYLEVMPKAQLIWDLAAPVTLVTAPGAIAAVFTNLLRNALYASVGAQGPVGVPGKPLSSRDPGPGQ